jgi:hypothetical protein
LDTNQGHKGGGGDGTSVAHSLIFKYAQMFICNTYVTLLLLDFEKIYRLFAKSSTASGIIRKI